MRGEKHNFRKNGSEIFVMKGVDGASGLRWLEKIAVLAQWPSVSLCEPVQRRSEKLRNDLPVAGQASGRGS
jgi:hypothetical protein